MNDGQRTMNKGRKGSLFRFRQWPVYELAKSFRERIRGLDRKLVSKEMFIEVKGEYVEIQLSQTIRVISNDTPAVLAVSLGIFF